MPCKPCSFNETTQSKLSSFDETTQAPVEAGGVKTFMVGIKSKTDIYVLLLVIAIFLILVFGKK